jgi:preprotein translocase subunit SecE
MMKHDLTSTQIYELEKRRFSTKQKAVAAGLVVLVFILLNSFIYYLGG